MSASKNSLRALRNRQVPHWWQDAKLGIFVHWTPASVPAFAPVGAEIGELLQSSLADPLKHVPYSEWYENSLRFEDSEVSAHHKITFGSRPYTEFARDFEAGLDQWDPAKWAWLFKQTGARYVVLVAKHSDGYCLWPTDTANPNRENWHSTRDVVGEMAESIRALGMRFGLYYSGGFDWSFDSTPVGTMADVASSIPQGAYPAYAEAQVRELIDRYRPSVLWNDIAWPSTARKLWPLLEYYYRSVPEGVINDRWLPWSPVFRATKHSLVRSAIISASRKQAQKDGGLIPPKPPFFDYRTPEYVVFKEVQPTPWELVRGMDRSFGHNRASEVEHFVTRKELLWQFSDVVAKGGNMLLNVGPRGEDAQIPALQEERLTWLGKFVVPNERALMDTRPWVVPGGTTPEGLQVRFTTRGEDVFVLICKAKSSDASTRLTLEEFEAMPSTRVELIGGDPVAWSDTEHGLVVDIGQLLEEEEEPLVIVLHQVQAREVQAREVQAREVQAREVQA
ncbi:MAG: alpha-L-fucosidase, partial [Microthrixaceae bacterium]